MTVLSEPALANKTYSRAKSCYQNQYVETYHPGTREKPGYVSSREERVERPCPKTQHFQPQTQGGASRPQPFRSSTDNVRRTKGYGDSRSRGRHSCLEGTLAGGVLGGALGGALAKKDNWIWSIPAGAVGGALVGCQVDGG